MNKETKNKLYFLLGKLFAEVSKIECSVDAIKSLASAAHRNSENDEFDLETNIRLTKDSISAINFQAASLNEIHAEFEKAVRNEDE